MAAGSLPMPINSDLHVEPDYGKFAIALQSAHEECDELILCQSLRRARLLVHLALHCGLSIVFVGRSFHTQRAGGRAVIHDRRRRD